MLTLLALLSSPADARAFGQSAIPYTTTFDYDWVFPTSVTGSTTFTFETATRRTDSPNCGLIAGCFNGAFTTGNGGEGTYSTDIQIDNCTPVTPPTGAPFEFIQTTCDVFQDLLLNYDVTNAQYEGTAECGTVTGSGVYLNGDFAGFSGAVSTTFVPGPFSGDTRIPPVVAVGTFSEP